MSNSAPTTMPLRVLLVPLFQFLVIAATTSNMCFCAAFQQQHLAFLVFPRRQPANSAHASRRTRSTSASSVTAFYAPSDNDAGNNFSNDNYNYMEPTIDNQGRITWPPVVPPPPPADPERSQTNVIARSAIDVDDQDQSKSLLIQTIDMSTPISGQTPPDTTNTRGQDVVSKSNNSNDDVHRKLLEFRLRSTTVSDNNVGAAAESARIKAKREQDAAREETSKFARSQEAQREEEASQSEAERQLLAVEESAEAAVVVAAAEEETARMEQEQSDALAYEPEPAFAADSEKLIAEQLTHDEAKDADASQTLAIETTLRETTETVASDNSQEEIAATQADSDEKLTDDRQTQAAAAQRNEDESKTETVANEPGAVVTSMADRVEEVIAAQVTTVDNTETARIDAEIIRAAVEADVAGAAERRKGQVTEQLENAEENQLAPMMKKNIQRISTDEPITSTEDPNMLPELLGTINKKLREENFELALKRTELAPPAPPLPKVGLETTVPVPALKRSNASRSGTDVANSLSANTSINPDLKRSDSSTKLPPTLSRNMDATNAEGTQKKNILVTLNDSKAKISLRIQEKKDSLQRILKGKPKVFVVAALAIVVLPAVLRVILRGSMR